MQIKTRILKITLATALVVAAPFSVFAAGMQHAPDNTGVNQRDQYSQTSNELTADVQSNSKRDIQITQRIRRELLEDDSLSTYAQNVKIITVNGKVTLKGPVRSASEKSLVGQKANAVAGNVKVYNQLEVAARE